MIPASATKLLVGITDENIERLRDGHPLRIADRHGLGVDVIVFLGDGVNPVDVVRLDVPVTPGAAVYLDG